MAPKGLFVRPFLGHLDNDHLRKMKKSWAKTIIFVIFNTLDDDHLRKMKKPGPQNMTNIDF